MRGLGLGRCSTGEQREEGVEEEGEIAPGPPEAQAQADAHADADVGHKVVVHKAGKGAEKGGGHGVSRR